MERNEYIEKIIGGVFALVAIIAAVIEMTLGGFSAEAIIGGIKDIFGTLVVVVLFFAVAKDIIPKNKFEDKLKAALEAWQKENENMIIRDSVKDIERTGEAPSCYSLCLKTHVEDFYKDVGVTKEKGVFLRMPLLTKENYSRPQVKLKFFLNKGTFFSDLPKGADTPEHYDALVELFVGLLNSKHKDFVKAGGKGKEITVELRRAVQNQSDIKELIDVINTMYTAYLVAANLGK